MNQIAHPPVLEAMQQLKRLSADEEARNLAEARELALFTERIEIDAAEKRGEARGEAKTMEKAVRQLMANGMTEATARSMLGLS